MFPCADKLQFSGQRGCRQTLLNLSCGDSPGLSVIVSPSVSVPSARPGSALPALPSTLPCALALVVSPHASHSSNFSL